MALYPGAQPRASAVAHHRIFQIHWQAPRTLAVFNSFQLKPVRAMPDLARLPLHLDVRRGHPRCTPPVSCTNAPHLQNSDTSCQIKLYLAHAAGPRPPRSRSGLSQTRTAVAAHPLGVIGAEACGGAGQGSGRAVPRRRLLSDRATYLGRARQIRAGRRTQRIWISISPFDTPCDICDAPLRRSCAALRAAVRCGARIHPLPARGRGCYWVKLIRGRRHARSAGQRPDIDSLSPAYGDHPRHAIYLSLYFSIDPSHRYPLPCPATSTTPRPTLATCRRPPWGSHTPLPAPAPRAQRTRRGVTERPPPVVSDVACQSLFISLPLIPPAPCPAAPATPRRTRNARRRLSMGPHTPPPPARLVRSARARGGVLLRKAHARTAAYALGWATGTDAPPSAVGLVYTSLLPRVHLVCTRTRPGRGLLRETLTRTAAHTLGREMGTDTRDAVSSVAGVPCPDITSVSAAFLTLIHTAPYPATPTTPRLAAPELLAAVRQARIYPLPARASFAPRAEGGLSRKAHVRMAACTLGRQRTQTHPRPWFPAPCVTMPMRGSAPAPPSRVQTLVVIPPRTLPPSRSLGASWIQVWIHRLSKPPPSTTTLATNAAASAALARSGMRPRADGRKEVVANAA
ncbi:hypothetical protein BJ912DRAFT_1048984 [Pholiota molesta]|nr:hypothetical protein BJ912DRAFT_1048984 [Pholiota molesta]